MVEKLWDVFISYKSGADQASAFGLVAALEEKQIKCWIAPRDIPATTSEIVSRGLMARAGYDDAIPFALEHSLAMVVMVSAGAMTSDHVKDEINLAKDGGLGFFPVRIEEVALQNSFRYHLGRAQWNDCFDPTIEPRFAKVVADIQTYIGSQQRMSARPGVSGGVLGARIQLSARGLWIADEQVPLQPDVLSVLVALAARRNRAVAKMELLDLAYPDTSVDDSTLGDVVATLREILGLHAITTIPGRGYQFSAELDPASVLPALIDEPVLARATEAIAPAPTSENTFALQSNLPEKLPLMLGREDDMAEIADLVAKHELVTIVGAGGLGKTCLAQHVLYNQRSNYPGGISWIELAALTDPVLLPSVIASSAGLQIGNGDALTNLVAGLKHMRALLVLDNAEHMIEDVARVAQAILSGTSQVRLVVTSQLPLKQDNERVYRLGTLAVPPRMLPVNEAMRFGAVALFVERAQAADRRFMLTPQNVGTVITICERLDGMALAIALAAARVSLLGVEKLADALNNRLRLLTGGNRSAPQRHQTLRAALEWSHGLLSLEEQTVFRRLGVFAGGFTLEMAQTVIADDFENPGGAGDAMPLDEWAVVEVLGALVDRSLVMTDANDPPRYRLQESPRAFALERLAAAGEEQTWRGRHAHAVVVRFSQTDMSCWAGKIGVDALVQTLEDDLDNGREALQWTLENEPLAAVELAGPFSAALTVDRPQERDLLWTATAEIVERIDSGELPATDVAGIPLAPAAWQAVRAAWALGCARSWGMRDAALSAHWSREAIAHYRTGKAGSDQIHLYLGLAMLCCATGAAEPTPDELDALRELREIEQARWPARVKCWGARAASFVELGAGNFEAAQAAFKRNLTLAEQSGDSNGINGALSNLANVALASGAVTEAIGHGTTLEERLNGTNHQRVLAITRLNLCAALLANDDVEAACRIARVGWPTAVQFKNEHYWADSLALMAALQGHPRSAALLCGYADTTNNASGVGRETNEAKARAKAEELARAGLAADTGSDGLAAFAKLHAEGMSLHADDIEAIAFSDYDA